MSGGPRETPIGWAHRGELDVLANEDPESGDVRVRLFRSPVGLDYESEMVALYREPVGGSPRETDALMERLDELDAVIASPIRGQRWTIANVDARLGAIRMAAVRVRRAALSTAPRTETEDHDG